MKEIKKTSGKSSDTLGLDSCFDALEQNLSLAIDTLDDVKSLKSARKELKNYRLAISAIRR